MERLARNGRIAHNPARCLRTRGQARFELKPGGIHCFVEFPLTDGECILDTDAGRRMSGAEAVFATTPVLPGRRQDDRTRDAA
jgi:predicted methyltransferase